MYMYIELPHTYTHLHACGYATNTHNSTNHIQLYTELLPHVRMYIYGSARQYMTSCKKQQ